jgi:hypothetical protein
MSSDPARPPRFARGSSLRADPSAVEAPAEAPIEPTPAADETQPVTPAPPAAEPAAGETPTATGAGAEGVGWKKPVTAAEARHALYQVAAYLDQQDK